jgi:RNA-binding protein
MLTSKQRAYLSAMAHDKKPVVLLGHKGVTDPVIAETKAALLAHELIKARLAEGGGDDEARQLAEGAGAELVDRLGRVVILYRRHPDKPKIKLPSAQKAKGLFDVNKDGAADAGGASDASDASDADES